MCVYLEGDDDQEVSARYQEEDVIQRVLQIDNTMRQEGRAEEAMLMATCMGHISSNMSLIYSGHS